MDPSTAIGVVVGIAIVFLILGTIIVLLHSRHTFSGYEELSGETRQIQSALKGELFRDGGDLVVAGNYNRLPTVVRFSSGAYTSGLSINMKAPSTFGLSVAPKGERTTEGRVLVRSSDEMFDARFVSRSDHPTQAKMFLGGKSAMGALQKLMFSSKTFLTVSTGEVELSELVVPGNAGRHVIEHVKQMGQLADALRQMPGGEGIKIEPLQREGRTLARLAIAALVVAGVLTVVSATQPVQPEAATLTEESKLPAGVLPVDAVTMARLPGYHLATVRDLTPQAAAWMAERRLPTSGRLSADFSGADNRRDVAYLLVAPNGEKRIVLLANGDNKYDAIFPHIDVMARLPWRNFKNVQWVGPGPKPPDGDALLLVRDLNDHASGVVLYLNDKQLVSAVPADFQSVSLE